MLAARADTAVIQREERPRFVTERREFPPLIADSGPLGERRCRPGSWNRGHRDVVKLLSIMRS